MEKKRKGDGNDTLTARRHEEVLTYLGAIGKEVGTLEKLFGTLEAVRLLLYLVAHAGLRGVVTPTRDAIREECSLTRGKLKAARQELEKGLYITVEDLRNRTRYTLDLARIAGACEAAGIGRVTGQNQPLLTTKQYITDYIPPDLQAFAKDLKLDLEWWVSGFGILGVRGGLKAMQEVEKIRSPVGLLYTICLGRARGWQEALTFPLEPGVPAQSAAETGSDRQEPEDLGSGKGATGPGSSEKAEAGSMAFRPSAPRPGADAPGPSAEAKASAVERLRELAYRTGQRQVYAFHVDMIVDQYRHLCTQRGVRYDSITGGGRECVEHHLQQGLKEAYLLAGIDWGIRNGVYALADLCREPPEAPGNLQDFERSLESAVEQVGKRVSGKGWPASEADTATIRAIFEEMQLNAVYFGLGEVYRWAIGLPYTRRKVFSA